LFTILSWYTTEDFVEDIDEFLEMFLLVERGLPLISLKLSGEGSARKSIPVPLKGNTVGNVKA